MTKQQKTTTAPKTRKTKKTTAGTQEAAPLQLTQVEVLKLRLFIAEQERHSRQRLLTSIQRTSYLKQIDPQDMVGKLDRELTASDAANEMAKKEYQAVIEAVESRLQLKLTDYSFDSDTGLLHKVQQPT